MSKKPAKRASSPSKTNEPKVKIAGLLGIGLDNHDGHKRLTRGEQFAIVGGSEETHDRMTETVVKTFEELKHRGKHLQQVEPRELRDIIEKSTPR